MNKIVSFLELNTLDYCFLLNLFIICLYLLLFNLIWWCYMPVGCTCNGGTGLWSMGNCITSSWILRITLLCPCFCSDNVFIALLDLVCCWLLFSVSPLCMIHLLISTCLSSSPMACPPSSVLCKLFSCRPIWFNIYVTVIYVVQLKCDGIISFMFAMALLHLLFKTLGYSTCLSNFCLHVMLCIMFPIFCIFLCTYYCCFMSSCWFLLHIG